VSLRGGVVGTGVFEDGFAGVGTLGAGEAIGGDARAAGEDQTRE
jgi:hypothetical protein